MRPLAMTASPALVRVAGVSSGNGHREIFAVTAAGELVHRWRYSDWSDWDMMDNPVPAQDVAATSPADGRLACAVADVYGRVWHRFWSGREWTDWQKMPVPHKTASPVLTRIAMVSGWRGEDHGHQEIFAVTAAGEVVHCWRDAKSPTWSDWHAKAVPAPAADITATSNSSGHIECLIVCSDGRLYYQWFSKKMRWSAWRPINDLLQNSRTEAVELDGTGQ